MLQAELKQKLREAQRELQNFLQAVPRDNALSGNTASSQWNLGDYPDRSLSTRQPSTADNLLSADDTNTESSESRLKSIPLILCPDPLMDLFFSGWNPDLPEPAILLRLYVLNS